MMPEIKVTDFLYCDSVHPWTSLFERAPRVRIYSPVDS